MSYDPRTAWESAYRSQTEIAYPAEGVIRIFKGRFPKLNLPTEHKGLSILDLGCGDGRHLPFFASLGFEVSAVEISDNLCESLQQKMSSISVPVDIRCGHAGNIPFDNGSFDRLLTWNSCYYMSAGEENFQDHVKEMARVIKPGGWIIASIPKKMSFIFNGSEPANSPGYRVIRDDYFGARNGEVMRCLENQVDLEESFCQEFEGFCHADIDMNWFGLAYHWHVFCARKKS
ncbi:class I SAM-dependent methyltransferase [Pelagibius litoralis]|uniref:Class I SAM-dependent methyltransferase n=1 Tax=Pelagibius litoralis TaxID=374515 RepID=A0A967EY29_9PROT|nr:class I SAM-dependent methyltransferase [Pelagibius litoralis]NIA69547.1 class I SAM-dependent methyltransferase [Pelagibius litoralis]